MNQNIKISFLNTLILLFLLIINSEIIFAVNNTQDKTTNREDIALNKSISSSSEEDSENIQSLDTSFYSNPKQCYIKRIYNILDNQLKIELKKGNGKGRIIIMREGENPTMPKDSLEYKSSNIFGKGNNIDNKGSFVVFNSLTDNIDKIRIEGLKPGTDYYLKGYEFSGSGANTKYLKKDTVSISHTSTCIAKPIANQATLIKTNSFTASWKEVSGAVSYILEVAYDEKFTQILPDYDKIKVGNVKQYEVKNITSSPNNSKNVIFYRIQALSDFSASEYSNIVMVQLNK